MYNFVKIRNKKLTILCKTQKLISLEKFKMIMYGLKLVV